MFRGLMNRFPPASAHPSSPVASLLLIGAMALAGCGIDGLLVQELTRQGHQRMPEPANVVIVGEAPAAAGGQVTLLAGSGKTVGGASTTAAADGGFELSLDGKTELVNVLLQAKNGGRQLFALVPFVPAQASVLDPELRLNLTALSPGVAQLNDRTTTMALLVAARAKADGKSLVAIPSDAMTDTLIDVHAKLVAGQSGLLAVNAAVQRILAAPTGVDTPAPFDPNGTAGSLLIGDFLLASDVDVDGDGQRDTTTAAFDALIANAIQEFKFKACYAKDRIKVVIQVRLSTAAKNRNCEAIDPFLWANDAPGNRMFITGGVHKTTPVCTDKRTTHCIQPNQIDALNAMLGGWVPNKVRMHDDGSNGDAAAGDGIWTLAFVAPWWPVKPRGGDAGSPDLRGVRIGYKFTWGSDGAKWGGSEEFPGNQRILELADVNEDGLIVRFDHFGDEASNKDKANQLAPALGGCGELKWPDEASPADCQTDVHERKADLDGDCKVDAWPDPGTAAPLTLTCPN